MILKLFYYDIYCHYTTMYCASRVTGCIRRTTPTGTCNCLAVYYWLVCNARLCILIFLSNAKMFQFFQNLFSAANSV